MIINSDELVILYWITLDAGFMVLTDQPQISGKSNYSKQKLFFSSSGITQIKKLVDVLIWKHLRLMFICHQYIF